MAQIPTVSDFMDEVFVKLHPETSISVAIDILLKKKLTGALVVDHQDRLLGILSEKDCLNVVLPGVMNRIPDHPVGDYMHEAPFTVPSTMTIPEVARVFLEHRFRRLPVLEGDKLIGQITRRDVLRGFRNWSKQKSSSNVERGSFET